MKVDRPIGTPYFSAFVAAVVIAAESISEILHPARVIRVFQYRSNRGTPYENRISASKTRSGAEQTVVKLLFFFTFFFRETF